MFPKSKIFYLHCINSILFSTLKLSYVPIGDPKRSSKCWTSFHQRNRIKCKRKKLITIRKRRDTMALAVAQISWNVYDHRKSKVSKTFCNTIREKEGWFLWPIKWIRFNWFVHIVWGRNRFNAITCSVYEKSSDSNNDVWWLRFDPTWNERI